MRFWAVLTLALAASPAHAQSIEVTPLASIGYTRGANVEMRAAGVEDLDIAGGLTWGAQAGVLVTDRVAVEAMWTRQFAHMELSTSSGRASLFDLTVDVIHGNVVYAFAGRRARVQPFVLGGVGASLFAADDLQHETKLSWAVGGGVKWFPIEHVGARVQARFKPTHLDASSSSFCDPFGFCQNWLNQLDITGGLTLRF
jgi:hypothetical protein